MSHASDPLPPGPPVGRSDLRPQQGRDGAAAEGRVDRQRDGRRAARRRRQARDPADRRARGARGAGRRVGDVRADRRDARRSCGRSSTTCSAASRSSSARPSPWRRRAASARSATPSRTSSSRGNALLTTSWFWGPYQTLCDEADRRLETFAMFGGRRRARRRGARRRPRAPARERSGARSLFFNDPCHNPTGYSMTDDEWRAVVDRLLDARRRGRRDAPGRLRVLPVRSARSARVPARTCGRSSGKRRTPLRVEREQIVHPLRPARRRARGVRGRRDRARRRRGRAQLLVRGTWSNCNRGGLAAITRLLVDPEMARARATPSAPTSRRLLRARVDAFNRHARERGAALSALRGRLLRDRVPRLAAREGRGDARAGRLRRAAGAQRTAAARCAWRSARWPSATSGGWWIRWRSRRGPLTHRSRFFT